MRRVLVTLEQAQIIVPGLGTWNSRLQAAAERQADVQAWTEQTLAWLAQQPLAQHPAWVVLVAETNIGRIDVDFTLAPRSTPKAWRTIVAGLRERAGRDMTPPRESRRLRAMADVLERGHLGGPRNPRPKRASNPHNIPPSGTASHALARRKMVCLPAGQGTIQSLSGFSQGDRIE